MSAEGEVLSIQSSKPISISSDPATNPSKTTVIRRLYSASDRALQDSADQVVSLSTPSERCPVSWNRVLQLKKPKHSLVSQESNTPSPQTKVNHWLQKSTILARHDFQAKKPYSISSQSSKSSLKKLMSKRKVHNTPEENPGIYKKYKVFQVNTGDPNAENVRRIKTEYELQHGQIGRASMSSHSSDFFSGTNSKVFNIFVSNSDQKPRISDIPSSPESQKKKELCNYLQLVNMNMVKKKEATPVLNRRSKRVKNYIMSNLKKQETIKQLEEDDWDTPLPESDYEEPDYQYTAEKSFKDLQVKTEVTEEAPTLPSLPLHVTNKVEHFDPYIKRYLKNESVFTSRQQEISQRKLRLLRKQNIMKAEQDKKKQNYHIKNLTGQSRDLVPKRKYNKRPPPLGPKRILRSRSSVPNVEAEPEDEKPDLKDVVVKKEEIDIMGPKEEEIEIIDICLKDHDYTFGSQEFNDPPKYFQQESFDFFGFDDTEDPAEDDFLSYCKNEEVKRKLAILSESFKLESLLVKKSRKTDLEQIYSPKNFKLLHKNLAVTRHPRRCINFETECGNEQLDNWEMGSPSSKQKKRSSSHSIVISDDKGPVIAAFYIDFNLVVAQELAVNFWMQSALGNILGAQNMWVPKGQIDRLVPDNGSVLKRSPEMLICSDNSVTYVELWTKEHRSEKRERPVTDIFATVYFCMQMKNGLTKKVLQLENIIGYANDVQYVVLTYSPVIIVSWSVISGDDCTTTIRCYHFASDYQSIEKVLSVPSVDYYVSSLHNVQDFSNLVLGCSKDRATLWNWEQGFVLVSVEINDTLTHNATLCVKGDRGFLFMLQVLETDNLCLIAINGINHSWKRLQTYVAPPGYEGLQGACLENGILVAFYKNGILCWNVLTGELRVEEISIDSTFIPSRAHVIMINKGQLFVRHAGSYLITWEDT